jgi:hypothetical protein
VTLAEGARPPHCSKPGNIYVRDNRISTPTCDGGNGKIMYPRELGLNAASRRGGLPAVQGLPKRQGVDQQFDHGLPQSDVLRFEDQQEIYRPALTLRILLLSRFLITCL